MFKRVFILFMLLLLLGCQEERAPEVPEELVEVEEHEEPRDLEEMARSMVASEGDVLAIKRVLRDEIPLVEVSLKRQDGLFIYSIDPIQEEIVSVEPAEELDLKKAHFLARAPVMGTTELRGVWIQEDSYLFLFEQDKRGFEVELDKISQEARLIGEKSLEELTGKVNMDLFEALEKFEVIYGEIILEKLYYEPGDDHSSYIVIEGKQEIGGELVHRSFEMETYGGVIWEN